MEYKEALDFLKNLTKFGINLGLERIEKLLELMNDPHKKLRVVHVGGTNGKGSTCAMLVNILENAGYKAGLFTSPHIHCYRERFRVNGDPVSEDDMARLITEAHPLLNKMVEEGFEHPTEFEVNTAMAFKYFYDEGVDIAVIEVGLGGDIDSTNVVDPLLSIITNVNKDHMNYLGNTITEIASVKSGIIKEDSLVLTGETDPLVLEVLERVGREKAVPVFRVDKEVDYHINNISEKGAVFDYYGIKKSLQKLEISLLGAHQIRNAVMSIAAAELLEKKGYSFDENAIRAGLKTVIWPARLELFKVDDYNVILDVAHNLSGIVGLKSFIEDHMHYGKLILIVGLLEDKEREEIAAEIVPCASKVFVTKPQNDRAGDWEQVAHYAGKFSSDVEIVEDIKETVEKALGSAEADDLICITGSFYMVCNARLELLERKRVK